MKDNGEEIKMKCKPQRRLLFNAQHKLFACFACSSL